MTSASSGVDGLGWVSAGLGQAAVMARIMLGRPHTHNAGGKEGSIIVGVL
jgi:hypothetical protein